MKGQAADEILRYFGKSISGARRSYRTFIADGVAQGKRRNLVGLGAVMNENAEAPLPCDSRILGDADFVERLRAESGLKERISAMEPVETIVARFAAKFDVSPRAVASSSRLPRLLDARAAVCHAAIEAGHSGAEIARHLGMTRSGVFTAKKRAENLLKPFQTFEGISLAYASRIDKITTSPCTHADLSRFTGF